MECLRGNLRCLTGSPVVMELRRGYLSVLMHMVEADSTFGCVMVEIVLCNNGLVWFVMQCSEMKCFGRNVNYEHFTR